MRKAFRYFDIEKTGSVMLAEFKTALDLMSMRISDKEVKNLFGYLDRKKDGVIDYDEFCDILEERKILKVAEKVDYDPVTGKVKKPREAKNPHVNYFDPHVDE
mmetsp:Transcript_36391/g.32658  ORF Transcript_36391/g.32658 Transcript_36391/m.32658 type:complete len:103 (+) Transcript_36391:1153-1461(+)|eukprot:CAMPEP_0114595292 /NCGR_PEP_ID=MMETSP0125-20121206/17062_1 /TAXON_ID=485358 ORGANISM="Aristerostoma sp., Strain ATCC 50986" /NCGR_SAMPLE_ID=MMETSP0125 /ASSEMBLY_ACC=CAM_ASM_000245 /LENGTH=102 /DNA_ID=CAMNT_0001796677 /DNA_START=1095 /DNA_END=1403 /DNA_ORIENTATION=+